MLTRHSRTQVEQICWSYCSCVFQPCIYKGWVLETSLSNHYWRKSEVGQRLVFGWFWGWGTSNTQLTRWKLGKKTHPNHGGHHPPMAAMVLSPRHRLIQQLANMLHNKSVVKTREYYGFCYLLDILRHDALLKCRACVFCGCGWWKPVIITSLINRVGWLKLIGLFRIMGFQKMNLYCLSQRRPLLLYFIGEFTMVRARWWNCGTILRKFWLGCAWYCLRRN